MWKSLLSAQSECLKYLTQLDIEENNNKIEVKRSLQKALAILCSENISNVAYSIIFKKKKEAYEEKTLEFINKIDVSPFVICDIF